MLRAYHRGNLVSPCHVVTQASLFNPAWSRLRHMPLCGIRTGCACLLRLQKRGGHSAGDQSGSPRTRHASAPPWCAIPPSKQLSTLGCGERRAREGPGAYVCASCRSSKQLRCFAPSPGHLHSEPADAQPCTLDSEQLGEEGDTRKQRREARHHVMPLEGRNRSTCHIDAHKPTDATARSW